MIEENHTFTFHYVSIKSVAGMRNTFYTIMDLHSTMYLLNLMKSLGVNVIWTAIYIPLCIY